MFRKVLFIQCVHSEKQPTEMVSLKWKLFILLAIAVCTEVLLANHAVERVCFLNVSFDMPSAVRRKLNCKTVPVHEGDFSSVV